MQISQDENQAHFHINRYEPGQITINRIDYTNSIILTPQNIISPWEPQNIEQLQPKHLDEWLQLKPEIFLLGTGGKMHIPSDNIRNHAFAHQVSIEFMDTHSACRTFNLLIADHRFVIAALLIQ